MTIRNDIIELLIKNELTINEINRILNIPKNRLSSYLTSLKNKKKIEIVDNDRKPYIFRAITPKSYLKRLYDLMDNKMDFSKKATNEDINLIIQIERMIK